MNIIPHHVGFILDGNRRWSAEHKKISIEGHRKGAYVVEDVINYLRSQGVHTITVWVFSTENWTREKEQVKRLLGLFEEFITRYLNRAFEEQTRVVHLGRKDRLPESLGKKISDLEYSTKKFTNGILNIALDYGGRDEIVRAVQAVIKENLNSEDITEEKFSSYMDTSDQPYSEPDMIIRTGGAKRLSGFMSWQSVYSELFFIDKYLPDVNVDDIEVLLDEYKGRKRRFGK